MSDTAGAVGQSANSVDFAQQAGGEKPGPRQNEGKDEWIGVLLSKFASSTKQWSNAENFFERPAPAAGDEEEESKNQRRLAYHRKIEKIAQDLLRATDAVADAYAPKGGLKGRALILRIRETIGDKYMDCEKYDKAEEQYNIALWGWAKEVNSSEGGEMRNIQIRRLLSCRRSVAVAICRGARTKTEPQKTRLEALKLVMENINGEKHGDLELDVRCCDDIAFRLVEGTYPPPGSDEDSYEVCLEHIATLKKASVQLETSNEEAIPKLRVFILRMKVRILELLEEDLGDLDGATNIYDALKKIEPQSYMEQLDDSALKDLVNRLLGYVHKFGDRDEKRRETRRRWTTALQAAATAPAPAPDPSVRDTEDGIQGDSRPLSLRKTSTGLSTTTEVSDTGKEENDAEYNDDGDSFYDGIHGEVMEENHQKNRKHWHEKWIKKLKDFSEITLRHAPAIGPNLAVKLTVIDTGIHAAHPRFEDIKDWSRRFKDFSRIGPPEVGDNNSGENSEPQIHATQGGVGDMPVDEDGHGTFIAGLLLDLVPGLDLYIARIGTTRDEIASDRDIAYKIGKAVDHAVTEWETEIISISVGCNSTGDVRDPIRKAIFKNVVVLAASGNAGNSTTPLYPATEDRVFKIYSASTLANPSPISGTATDLKFSFHTLGEDIQSIWPGQLVHNLGRHIVFRCGTKEKEERKRLREEKRKVAKGISVDGKEQVVEHKCSEKCQTSIVTSGTSFAAPIAAAIVAIIYQFYNTYKFQIDSHLRPGCEGLKSIESIRHILTRMGGPRRAADGSLGIVFLQAPSYRTGSDFHFEPVDTSRRDSAIHGKFQLKEDDKDEWGHTYDEFFWRQLVRVINDAKRHGGI